VFKSVTIRCSLFATYYSPIAIRRSLNRHFPDLLLLAEVLSFLAK
jgi:hypothetical protein